MWHSSWLAYTSSRISQPFAGTHCSMRYSQQSQGQGSVSRLPSHRTLLAIRWRYDKSLAHWRRSSQTICTASETQYGQSKMTLITWRMRRTLKNELIRSVGSPTYFNKWWNRQFCCTHGTIRGDCFIYYTLTISITLLFYSVYGYMFRPPSVAIIRHEYCI
jgi:hypothetical protein